MANPKIYISHFQPSFVVQSETMVPIQVGAALSPIRLDMIGDDTGNNISDENPLYCELTAHYWAWKNDTKSSHIGFFHYRRFLDIRGHQNHPKDTPHGIIEEEMSDDKLHEYGLIDDMILEVVDDVDLVVPKPYDVRSASFRSVEHHYRGSPGHKGKDFQTARTVVSEISPEYLKYFDRMAKGYFLYPANIFIAKRELFEEYARWIFPVLNSIRLLVDATGYNASEMRYLGYLAERLTTVFILKQLEANSGFVVKERPLLFIQDARPLPGSPPLPNTDLRVVSVVASSDEAYAPHLAALIASVFRNADKERFIDFIVLGDKLLTTTKRELQHLQRLHPHCSVQFVTMDRMFTKLSVHTYFATSTFYRLAMADTLYNRSRVLFLDTDMVVLGDVGVLFDIDLQGKLIGACKDLVMLSFESMGVPAMAEVGGMPAKLYVANRLGMRGREDEYFQAGTILFDLDAMRQTSLCSDMIDDLENRVFWFLDQDVLNKHLVGNVHFLDHKWNAVFLDQKHQNGLPDVDFKKYLKAQEDPSIIHFAGIAKPWLNDMHPMGNYYWYFLRDTFWYELMLINRLSSASRVPIGAAMHASGRLFGSPLRKLMSKVWRSLPNSTRPALGPIARYLAVRIR